MAGAWHEWELTLNDDGSVSGVTSTSDNLDEGHASEYAAWDVEFPDVATMLVRTHGGSHFGVGGAPCRVYLDGVLIVADEDAEGGYREVSQEVAARLVSVVD